MPPVSSRTPRLRALTKMRCPSRRSILPESNRSLPEQRGIEADTPDVCSLFCHVVRATNLWSRSRLSPTFPFTVGRANERSRTRQVWPLINLRDLGNPTAWTRTTGLLTLKRCSAAELQMANCRCMSHSDKGLAYEIVVCCTTGSP